MRRYIDADKLNGIKFNSISNDRYGAYRLGWNDAINAIVDNAPTVDVRENVRGEWFHISDGYCDVLKCSKCGKSTDSQSNFCPNCGAEMRGAQNE